MESLSGSGQAGIGIRDCTLQVRVLRLVLALASASLVGLAGVGTTGDLIGITTVSFSIITATSPTAESSSIATTLIARVRAEGSMAGGVFAGGGPRGVVGVVVGGARRRPVLRATAQIPATLA